MSKIHQSTDRIWFQCPGCKTAHAIDPSQWQWNGSHDAPTFSPSILTGYSNEQGEYFAVGRCHSFVSDGRIQFLDDCYHNLKGQTVDLPDWYSLFQQEPIE